MSIFPLNYESIKLSDHAYFVSCYIPRAQYSAWVRSHLVIICRNEQIILFQGVETVFKKTNKTVDIYR